MRIRFYFLAASAILGLTVLAADGGWCADLDWQMIQASTDIEHLHIAVMVPTEDGDSITGVRWVNNDSNVPFPKIYAVAGYRDQAPSVQDAIIVAEDVFGAESNWSEVFFYTPVVSPTEALYIVFELPGGQFAMAPGVGPGIGYFEDDLCEAISYFGGDGCPWVRFVPKFRLAVDGISYSNSGKSLSGEADPIVLPEPGEPVRYRENSEPTILQVSAAPNPFNPEVNIKYTVDQTSKVKIDIFDIQGRRVCGLVDGIITSGDHVIKWGGKTSAGQMSPSGIYFANVRIGSLRQVLRLVLVK